MNDPSVVQQLVDRLNTEIASRSLTADQEAIAIDVRDTLQAIVDDPTESALVLDQFQLRLDLWWVEHGLERP